ncbi:MAG TPA: TetR/AcrR family transcriptional regulator [Burkholderiaceae bacterium]|nr:TetR/AcrR family transcriptional regulator [Burkholderiaceae bacterium]
MSNARKSTVASPRQRSSYHHGDLRNALIDAALAQISVVGARALSLREVARTAGVSHTASYRHFPSKESLLAAIAEQGFVMLGDAVGTAVQAHPDDPLAALQASGIAYVEFGVQYPHHLQIMFGGVIGDHADHPGLKQAAEGAYERLREAVRNAQKSGFIRTGDERIIALASWAQVHGLALLIAGGQIASDRGALPPPRYLATEVTRLLQQGLATAAKKK